MTARPASDILIALPIADRQRSMDFYTAAFNFVPIGDLGDDGIPEPLQFPLNEHTRIMLVPTGGFGWVMDGREIAAPGTNEFLIGLGFDSEADVDQTAERVRAAGGTVTSGPKHQDWGYSAICTDPDGHAWQLTVLPTTSPTQDSQEGTS